MTINWDSKLGIDSKFGGPGVFDYEPISNHFRLKTKFNTNFQVFESPDNKPIMGFDQDTLMSLADMKPYIGKNGTGLFGNQQGSGQTLAYPADIDVSQDHIEIDEYAYKRPTSSGDAQNAAGPGATTKSGEMIGGTIILPMPKVTDASGAEWGKSDLTGDEMNRSTRASGWKGLFRRQGLNDRREENAKAYGNEFDPNAGESPEASRKGTNYIWSRELALRSKTAARNIGGNVSASSLLFRERGQILNPNTELLFQGPSLRSFDFNWLMVARNKKEGETIREIIRKLKLGAAPRWNNTMLLEVPSIWQISYKAGGSELRTVNRFKECALVSITADYAPDGIWSAYDDSQPIAVRMGLSFKELRAVYRADQEETHQQSVGY